MRILAMIPARIGSERLKKKNLALINKKPLIFYSINAAKKSGMFDNIFINSDDVIFKKIAKENNIGFYLRPKELGSSNTKSDDVVYDFLRKHKCDILVWINSIAPLQTHKEIKNAVKYFIKKKYNSLITTNQFYNHSLIGKKPLNFLVNSKFMKTQDLKPVQIMIYSQMMWKSKSFLNSYKKNKRGILHGKVGYFPVSRETGIIIKYKKDLELVSSLLKKSNFKLKYYN